VAKIRKIFQSFIIISLFLVTIAGTAHATPLKSVYSSSPFQETEPVGEDWQVNQEIPETYELMAENVDFQLYANKASLAFKVIDKRSGYVWNSNIDEKGEEDRLNKTWMAFADSGISIDYLDSKAIKERASITNSNHTLEVKQIEDGFEGVVNFLDISISIGVVVKLEPNGVRVEIPFDSIKEENEEFKLGMIYVYPFLGATREDKVPGYMFIPNVLQTGRYYGGDLGMITYLPWDPMINRPYKLSIPVMGMVHGEKQNAFVSIVEKGATYAELHVHPAGIITNFNFLYNAFIYNESYFQPTNRSGAGVTTIQPNSNAFDLKIHYRFLSKDDADYVGMAKSYQQYLIDRGDLNQISDDGDDIGIRLEFLGCEKAKILFWYRVIPMTTISQMSAILDDLNIQNPDVIYYGWQPLGASNMAPTKFKLEDELGSTNELRSLIEKIAEGGGNFYLYLDPQSALYEEKGYSSRYDLAMSITNNNLMAYNRNKVNYFLQFRGIKRPLYIPQQRCLFRT
jgi:hypothetical protein